MAFTPSDFRISKRRSHARKGTAAPKALAPFAVHLVGIVARGGSLSADQFVLLRYTIVHCVADAQPIGLLVRMPPAAADSTTNAWVEIDGTLASTEQGGAHLISVLATRITPTDEPPEPYLQSL